MHALSTMAASPASLGGARERGWLALRAGFGLEAVFLALAAGTTARAGVNAAAVALGAWFAGPERMAR